MRRTCGRSSRRPSGRMGCRRRSVRTTVRLSPRPGWVARGGWPGVGGLSRLAVWWIKLGITPERIVAGKPQQNGRHERVHRTLKEATATPPADSGPAQQQRFDDFRAVSNNERPHEALGQKTPAVAVRAVAAALPGSAHRTELRRRCRGPPGAQQRPDQMGGQLIFVGEALIPAFARTEPVGVAETQSGDWLVRYAEVELGYIHPQRR